MSILRVGGMVHGSPYISWFIIHKNRKITRARPIQKSNSTSFWSKIFFHRMNYKNVIKRGAAEDPAQIFLGSEYSRLVVLTDIKILPTPAAFEYKYVLNINSFISMVKKKSINAFPKKQYMVLKPTSPIVFIIEWWNKLHYIQE